MGSLEFWLAVLALCVAVLALVRDFKTRHVAGESIDLHELSLRLGEVRRDRVRALEEASDRCFDEYDARLRALEERVQALEADEVVDVSDLPISFSGPWPPVLPTPRGERPEVRNVEEQP